MPMTEPSPTETPSRRIAPLPMNEPSPTRTPPFTIAAVATWAAAPLIFKFWLGQKLYTTRAILPLVLIHTVIGCSSAVGRSILLGMGKVKPFTIAVVIAAVGNVILSYVLVRYCGLGLRGIVLGTITAVVCRCGLWQPWFVLRTLRREADDGSSGDGSTLISAASRGEGTTV